MTDFFDEKNLEGGYEDAEDTQSDQEDFILPDRKTCIFLNFIDPEQGSVVNREQDEIGNESWEALKGSGRELFQKGGMIVMPSFDEENNVSLEGFDTDKMIGLLSEEITFVKLKFLKGNPSIDIVMTPPRSIATYVLKNCDHSELKPVHACINHPFVLREESEEVFKETEEFKGYEENINVSKGYKYRIVNDEGIHDNGVYINPRKKVKIKVYDTFDEADYIIKDIFKDFPYESKASLSNTVAQLISACMRYAMGTEMPPIALTTAQTHGSGKSMETDCIHAIMYGYPAEWSPRINTIDEYRKTLLTHARAGSPMVCFDNLNDKLDIEALASAATSRKLSGRNLHTLDKTSVDNLMSICINGTAMDVSTEIIDRTLWKVMKTDKKTADRDFKYEALIDFQIKPNRPAILSALFTYIQKWIDKGFPISKEKSKKHRIKVWSGLMGGILKDTIWYDDFLQNADEQRVQADTTYVRWCHAMDEVARYVGMEKGKLHTTHFSIQEIMTVCSFLEYGVGTSARTEGSNMLGEDIGTESKNNQSRSTKLGILFRNKSKNGGTPYGNWKIVDAGQTRRRRNFKLEWIGDVLPDDVYYSPERTSEESGQELDDTGVPL